MNPESEWKRRLPVREEQLILLQQRLETRLRYDQITSGTRVPLDLLTELAQGLTPDMMVYNLGCGDGRSVIEQAKALQPLRLSVVGLDWNYSGIQNGKRLAKQGGVRNTDFLLADVTNPGWIRPRSAGVVISEALLCNLIGTDAETAVAHMSQLLTIGGYGVVADCLVANDESVTNIMVQEGYTPDEIKVWKQTWEERYKNNAIAMDLGDKAYTFIVMPPGEDKQKLELAPPPVLRELLINGKIERLARHWRGRDLIELFNRAGMKLLHWEHTVWKSRAKEPIAGMIAVFQKQEVNGIDTDVLAIPTMATMLRFAS